RLIAQTAATRLNPRNARWSMQFPSSVRVVSVGGDGAVVAGPLPEITIPDIRQGAVGRPYFEVMTVQGGTAPYAWQITGGTLPNGIAFDPTTGTLYGSPRENTVADYSLIFQVTDANGNSASKLFTLPVTATVGV